METSNILNDLQKLYSQKQSILNKIELYSNSNDLPSELKTDLINGLNASLSGLELAITKLEKNSKSLLIAKKSQLVSDLSNCLNDVVNNNTAIKSIISELYSLDKRFKVIANINESSITFSISNAGTKNTLPAKIALDLQSNSKYAIMKNDSCIGYVHTCNSNLLAITDLQETLYSSLSAFCEPIDEANFKRLHSQKPSWNEVEMSYLDESGKKVSFRKNGYNFLKSATKYVLVSDYKFDSIYFESLYDNFKNESNDTENFSQEDTD